VASPLIKSSVKSETILCVRPRGGKKGEEEGGKRGRTMSHVKDLTLLRISNRLKILRGEVEGRTYYPLGRSRRF